MKPILIWLLLMATVAAKAQDNDTTHIWKYSVPRKGNLRTGFGYSDSIPLGFYIHDTADHAYYMHNKDIPHIVMSRLVEDHYKFELCNIDSASAIKMLLRIINPDSINFSKTLR